MIDNVNPADDPETPGGASDMDHDAYPPPLLAPVVRGPVPIVLPASSDGRSVSMKFCDVCGAEWQAEWLTCQACAAAMTPPYGESAAGDRISISSPLALYFVLLSTFVPAIFLDDTTLAVVAVSIVDTLIVLIWCVVCRREVWPLVRTRPSLGSLMAAIGLGAATFATAHVSMGLLTEWLHLDELSYFDLNGGVEYGWGLVFLLICIQPALIEELAFRGVILGGLRSAMDDRDAVLVSAMMFMILHLQILSILHLLLLGICTGYLRVRTRSLWPCVMMHFTHNSLVLLFEYLQIQ
ncbi:MAG TPA: type II CAAX endopeptidase family protein [Phycisphaerae bacterium]|nr:type II CAAX endopeptidase family protein [Phycisphaerae bacterium]HRW54470.1 type II CAAX endopeptidase family protein [Phycisphaerae bacterium]